VELVEQNKELGFRHQSAAISSALNDPADRKKILKIVREISLLLREIERPVYCGTGSKYYCNGTTLEIYRLQIKKLETERDKIIMKYVF
jgi:hypothetical protein